MKLLKATGRSMFKLLAETNSAQAAVMVLRPGQSTGEPSNEHSGSEQWLYVIRGSGVARVGKRKVQLRENSLLLIEKGEVHQIVAGKRASLVTLNIYVPPAYEPGGEPRGVAKRAVTAIARGVGIS
jgi:mannose-6-phosphate isomerase-like protein (cupin superfamily)